MAAQLFRSKLDNFLHEVGLKNSRVVNSRFEYSKGKKDDEEEHDHCPSSTAIKVLFRTENWECEFRFG